MDPLLFAFGLLWISFCFAQVEIAIEGKHGWAGDLPTWRLPTNHWVSRVFFSGKPATGYHVWMEIFILSIFHLAYVFIQPTWHIEFQIIAFFLFFCVVEDFFWFVFNPAFGIRKFRRDKIWWHDKHWWFIAPRDYYVLSALGALMYYAASLT